MTCRSPNAPRSTLGRLVAVCVFALWCAAAAAQTPAQMKMEDPRGGLQGRVRNDAGVPVTGATVTAVNAENGAQFTATTDAQGAYSFGALPPGKYDISTVSAGLTAFRRTGIEVAAGRTAPLDIVMNAATAAEAAEFERQALLQRIATLEQRISDLESTAILSEPETRVRRVEVFVDERGSVLDQATSATAESHGFVARCLAIAVVLPAASGGRGGYPRRLRRLSTLGRCHGEPFADGTRANGSTR